MELSIPRWRSWRSLFPLATWTCAVCAAIWLYRGGIGHADAAGLAQVKEYKVSPVDLGRLASLEVVEGQRVSQGQVLARLETGLIEKEIAMAETRLRQIASEVRAQGVSLDVEVLQSERGFQSEIEAAEIELQAAQSSFSSDKAELDKVREDIQRQRDLVRRGLTRNDRLRELELRRAALEEPVRAWPQRIEAVEARRRAAAARLSEWKRTHAGSRAGNSRQTQLQPLYDRAREQQELVEMLKTRFENATLHAATGAYVSRILARPGDVLRSGDPVLMLIEAQPRLVVAYIQEGLGGNLVPGATVVGRRRSVSREQFPGKVTAVSGTVSQLPSRFWVNPSIPAWGREAYIEIPQSANLNPGEAVDIALAAARDRPAGRMVADSHLSQPGRE